jgi:hypothetical protein
MQILTEALIALWKYCASCSLIHQLCDLACIYRNSKQEVATIEVSNYSNRPLENNLRIAIFNRNNILGLSSGEVDKCVRTLLKIVASLRNHVTPKNIMSAAAKAGMTGDPTTWHLVTRKIPFQVSTHPWTAADWQTIDAAWSELIRQCEDEGYFPDAYLDFLNLPRGRYDTGINREDLTEIRWRVAQLNHRWVAPYLAARREAKRIAQEEAETRRAEAILVRNRRVLAEPILSEIEVAWKLIQSLKANVAESYEAVKRIHIGGAKQLDRHRVAVLLPLREQCLEYLSNSRTVVIKASSTRNTANEAAKRGSVQQEIQASLDLMNEYKDQIADWELYSAANLLEANALIREIDPLFDSRADNTTA